MHKRTRGQTKQVYWPSSALGRAAVVRATRPVVDRIHAPPIGRGAATGTLETYVWRRDVRQATPQVQRDTCSRISSRLRSNAAGQYKPTDAPVRSIIGAGAERPANSSASAPIARQSQHEVPGRHTAARRASSRGRRAVRCDVPGRSVCGFGSVTRHWSIRSAEEAGRGRGGIRGIDAGQEWAACTGLRRASVLASARASASRRRHRDD